MGGVPGSVLGGVLGWGKVSGRLYEGLRERERNTGYKETKVEGRG